MVTDPTLPPPPPPWAGEGRGEPARALERWKGRTETDSWLNRAKEREREGNGQIEGERETGGVDQGANGRERNGDSEQKGIAGVKERGLTRSRRTALGSESGTGHSRARH